MSRTDAERLEILLQQRDTLDDLITDLYTNPKPDYNVRGQQVLWGSYLEMLLKRKEDLAGEIAGFDDYEIRSYGH